MGNFIFNTLSRQFVLKQIPYKKYIAGSSTALFWLGIFPIWSLAFILWPYKLSVGGTYSTEGKHKNIPVLDVYKRDSPRTFWNSFPFKDLPMKPVSGVKTDILTKLILCRSTLLRDS